MKLRIFQSSKGDCILLQGKDGTSILCDGGMSTSMRDHVRAKLRRLVGADGLEAIYISHIDQDHISGVLQLLRDKVDWNVFERQSELGMIEARKPKFPEPPEIRGLWHNAFRDQVDENQGPIEDLLAASIPAFQMAGQDDLTDQADEALNIATSVAEALEVSQLSRHAALNIPINKLPGQSQKKLLFNRGGVREFTIGSLKFTIIGPTNKEMGDLRDGWNNWLDDNGTRVGEIQEEVKKRVKGFANGEMSVSPYDLGSWNGIRAFKGVTTPNVASLMLMVEEGDKRVLLTGDSQQDVIIEGLELAGFLEKGDLKEGHLHVDVLKVQHHGSEHNIDEKFCRQVSADHYVFCGNGGSKNPDLDVLDIVYESRLGAPKVRTLADKAQDRKFTFWFSTESRHSKEGSASGKHFLKVEKAAATLAKKSKGKMKTRFNTNAFRTLTL